MHTGRFADAKPRRVVVKTYGRGSLLGLLGPLISLVMAQRGMDGWQSYAAREMEKDAVKLAGKGYRVVSTEELGIPLLGITYLKATYELVGSSEGVTGSA